MLMSCSMEYDIRPVIIEYLFESSAVSDRTDKNYQIQLRVFILKLKLDGMSVILVNIKYY